jgi:hypothetical protein
MISTTHGGEDMSVKYGKLYAQIVGLLHFAWSKGIGLNDVDTIFVSRSCTSCITLHENTVRGRPLHKFGRSTAPVPYRDRDRFNVRNSTANMCIFKAVGALYLCRDNAHSPPSLSVGYLLKRGFVAELEFR